MRAEFDCPDLLAYLRSKESTRSVPVVCLIEDPARRAAVEGLRDQRVELVDVPYSLGGVLTKIATQLRLRKMAGSDQKAASLGEVNAALRDLNRRFAQQLEEARAIQESLLPEQLPRDDRFDVAVVYRPLEEVGGDWYFVQRGPEGALSMQLGDVTGHGLAAAFIGSMAKLALTAAGRDAPGELLTEMNRLMAPQLPPGRFVTMSAFRYDPDSGRVSAARAGHPPALVLHQADLQVEQLRGDGFAIGFFEDSQYNQIEARLEVGDLITVFSDGLIEAQNRSQEMYGIERMSAVLRTVAGEENSARVMERILTDFENFLDGRLLKDDLTLLVLRRRR